MESRIRATKLARTLGDVLGRVRFRRDVFVVERHGRAVARLTPLATDSDVTLEDAFHAWLGAAQADHRFADDLEQVNAADQPPTNPWD